MNVMQSMPEEAVQLALGETYPEMQRQQEMAEYIDQTLNRLKGNRK